MAELPGEELISASAIAERVQELGEEITRHYEGEPITVVGLMNGSIFFMVDLIRTLPPTTRIECWRVQSYLGQRSTGRIQGLDSVLGDYAGRRILLIDDILDSGLTLTQVKRSLLSQNAKSVDICVLLKKEGTQVHPLDAQWIGFNIPDRFIVGYGLDLDHQYRSLPMIRVIGDTPGHS
jgi:hypoxanthine phosphoribosyltransferase